MKAFDQPIKAVLFTCRMKLFHKAGEPRFHNRDEMAKESQSHHGTDAAAALSAGG